MFTYQPPKSSIWGHRLGRMPAARAHALLKEFLGRGVAAYSFGSAQLVVHGVDRELDTLLADALEQSLAGSGSYPLTEEGVERAVAAIARWQAEHPRAPTPVNLAQMSTIQAWRIGGRPSPTGSLLTMHYGALPVLSTMLQFESVAEFEEIRATLAAIGLCKLNPKHLKESRGRGGVVTPRSRK